ncbi:MAG: hypothetical protein M1608_17740 [Candidatus Omnitrophica bacterium]|nr:hypothetical protein [Candidatus Omnitrophota bacterium]
MEHHLFSEISKHWTAQPLASYETIVRLIRETNTQTGLEVNGYLITKNHETGQKVSARQINEIRVQEHPILPESNHTLLPH